MGGCVVLLDVNTWLKHPRDIVAIVAEMVLEDIPKIAQLHCLGSRILRILTGGHVVLLDVNAWRSTTPAIADGRTKDGIAVALPASPH